MLQRLLSNLLTRVCPPVIVLLIVGAAMQFYIRWQHVSSYLLPLPTDVVTRLIKDRADLTASLLTTAKSASIGFAASIFFGIMAGILLASSKWIRRAFYPFTLFFQTVPIIAIAPLLIFWLDAGTKSVATCAFIVSVFPVIAGTLAGLLATDPALLDLFQLYGASPIDRLLKLRLPYALPSIVTGLRIAAGLAVIGTIVSEFMVGDLGDDEGLGVKIVAATRNGHLDTVFASVLIASLLGLGMLTMVNVAGHLMLRRWHASERESS